MRNFRATFLGSISLAGATFLLAGSGALAAEAPAWEHDVGFGVAFTSDYVSRGASSTEHGAAVQPWAELDISKFYVGYWGSNVTLSGMSYWESDLSIGVRPEIGPVSFDFGYVRYIFSSTDYSTPSGEAYAKASFSPVEPLTLGAAFYVNPESTNATYSEINAAYAFHEKFKVSGALGYVTGNATFGSFAPWNLGVSWNPIEPLTLDARYQGGPDANKFVLTLSLATSVSALKAMSAK